MAALAGISPPASSPGVLNLKVKPILIAAIASLMVHGGLLIALNRSDSVLAEVHGQRPSSGSVHALAIRMLPSEPEPSLALPSDAAARAPNPPMPPIPIDHSEGSDQTEPTASDNPFGYYNSSQLWKHARPLQDIDLESLQGNWEPKSGSVVLNLWINANGLVVKTEIEHSDLSPAYADAIAAAFSRQKYSPGQIRGRPVNSIYKVEIDSTEAGP